jgi:2-polyprenyl-6-methoxyphenol hydroxylase-like FAD-dependent oxidoreductase
MIRSGMTNHAQDVDDSAVFAMSTISTTTTALSMTSTGQDDTLSTTESHDTNNKEAVMGICPKCRGSSRAPQKKKRGERNTHKKHFVDDNNDAAVPPPQRNQQEVTRLLLPSMENPPCPKCKGTGLVHAIISPTSKIPTRSDFHVAIVGGGIGGCGLALALQQRDISCTIYERDSHFSQRQQGYGLTMQQGAKALKALGYLGSTTPAAADTEFGIHSKRHVVHTPDGTIMGEWGMRVWGGRNKTSTTSTNNKNNNKRQNAHIPRQELRRILMDRLGPGTIQWGHRLLNYKQEDMENNTSEDKKSSKNLELTLQNETNDQVVTHHASVLIGADGIRSKVRECKIGKEASSLRYLNCLVVLGICPTPMSEELDLMDGETVFQTADGVTRLYAMPFSPGKTMWQLSFPMEVEEEAKALSDRGPMALKEEALKRCGQWHAPIPTLLEETPVSLISGYPVYDREILTHEQLRQSPTCRVTLIGDAAHPMSPFKGQGANQALLDAVQLARALFYYASRPDNPHDILYRVLSEFESSMLSRSSVKVKASAEAAQFLHSDVAIMEGNVTRGGAAAATSSCTKNSLVKERNPMNASNLEST